MLKGTYILEELDGTLLKGIYTGNQLKKFIYKEDIFVLESSLSNGLSSDYDLTNKSNLWQESSSEDNKPHKYIKTRNRN